MRHLHFIDGAFEEPALGAYFDVIDPATETGFASAAAGTAEDIDRAVQAARRAFDTGPWPRMTAQQRGDVLRRAGALIRQRLEEIAALETRDNGKPLPEAKWDIGDAAFCFDYYADLAEQIGASGDQPIDVGDARFASHVRREPIGVVAAITPWNYPFLMAVWKVAPALAAGCSVVLKPSELCPMSCGILAQILHKAGVPAGTFNLVTGTGPDAGAPLSAHPLVDKVAFTGSQLTGSKVMQAAARDIRSISLELGGKSPFIVFADSDLEKAVEWIMFGIFWNQGQVCSATSRLLVQRAIYPALLDRLKIEAEKITIGAGHKAGVLLGPLVSSGQYQKVCAAIAKAQADGARLITGGERPTELTTGYFIQPTVFADVPLGSDLWTEEVFGPVIAVRAFDTEAEAIVLANDTRYGLAAAVMSDDEARAERVAHALRAGIVWINCSQPTFTQAPWGGYKSSGIGRELGQWGFDAFCEIKQITRFDARETWGWYIKP